MKKVTFHIALFVFSFMYLFPLNVEASPLMGSKKGPTLNDQLGIWTDGINDMAPTVSFLFSAIFTVMFLAGVVRMGYSIVTKTGQIMKGSTGILIWVPVTFFFIRILILIMFTTDSNNVTLLASDIISLVRTTGYFTSIGMVLIGLVLFFFYKLIEHPEYGRWSKRLCVTAALLTLLATVMPFVLGAA
ncbi:hypothetical protein D1B31_18535 [Neobacillus notoginsengisoli]|uniref:Uncharacterized protein n=1 Tax=Neobacillus notoginsengisoli TaxID=1578198 RepID=A0A417YQT0_9BACI|nr:hypothetical protein [Neobacillus notoginsengisoli]RHW36076.1 hypothetical protein D1B31_18535 [Neobacillus notoginsengisoli]